MRRAAALLLASALGCQEPLDAPTDAVSAPDVLADTALAPVTDPLSMPAEPTLSPSAFKPAEQCASCHADHVAEWRGSHHAYAMIDPVFRALVAVRQTHEGGRSDRFCLQCHSAVATRGGEIEPGFRFEDLSPIALEGVTCEACHRVTSVDRPNNSGHRIDVDAPIGGPHATPVANDFHASRHDPLFEQSEFCAGCHDVVEVIGLPLERPYEEWLESPAGADGRTCQDCHMPASLGRLVTGGPERTRHSHRFVGVDVPATATGTAAETLDAAVQALLEGAADLDVEAHPEAARAGERLDVVVTVTSRVEGHSLPTGSAFLRELWVHAVVLDAEGRVIHETGALDEQGDLKGPFSELDPYGDPSLMQFGARLLDATGTPTIFPWRAVEVASTAIPAGHQRTQTLHVPVPLDAAGPLTVEATLRFRATPPHVLRALGMPPGVTIRDLVSRSVSVPVSDVEP